MRGPHVRFCERRGGVILRAYSTPGETPDRQATVLQGGKRVEEWYTPVSCSQDLLVAGFSALLVRGNVSDRSGTPDRHVNVMSS